MSTSTRTRYRDLPRKYDALVDILPPRPIHSDDEMEEVRAMIEVLAVQGEKVPKDQLDYLDALSKSHIRTLAAHFHVSPAVFF